MFPTTDSVPDRESSVFADDALTAPDFVLEVLGGATEPCAYCGPVCYRGAAHNARVEDGALYVAPQREIFYFPNQHSPARRMRHAEAAARHATEDVFAFGGS